MKIRLIRNTVANGVVAEAGSTVEVEDNEGRLLIAFGKAEEAKGKATKTASKPAPEPDAEPGDDPSAKIAEEKDAAKEATIATAVPGGKRK